MLPGFLENLDPGIYLSDNYVVIDFEIDTSHGDYGAPVHPDNRMLLACWKRRGEATRAAWGDEYAEAHRPMLDAISRADFIVAHNSKYELGWLRRLGVDLRKVLPFDTKLAEYVLLGNLAAGSVDLGMVPRSTSLDQCCRRRGP